MAASNQLLGPEAIHFFRIILEPTLRDGKLRIPRKFASRYGRGLPNPVFLKPPDGTKWKVHWKELDNEILFQHRWKEFDEYYSLDFGHLMIFKYEERSSTFEVIILDMSTLEIDYSSHESRTQDDSVETLKMDEMPLCKKNNRTKSSLKSLRPVKRLRTSINGEGGGAFDMQNLRLNKKAKISKQELEGAEFHPNNPELEDKMERTSFSPEKCAKSKAIRWIKSLSSPEKDQPVERVSSFTSKNPFFMLTMKPTYVSRNNLHLPNEFSREFLVKQQGDVVLQALDGRKWHAYCTVSLPGKKFNARIQTGWKSIYQDNNIKEGDVCVFELINSTVSTFNVHIYRAAENSSHPPSQEDRENSEGGAPHNNLTSVCPMDMNDVKGLPAPNKHKLAGKCSEDVATNLQVHGTMHISVEKAALLKVGRLTQKLPRALEVVSCFSIQNPFFRVNIVPSLLQRGRPNVPVGFLKKCMKSREQNMMIQLGKRSWPVKLVYYQHLPVGKLSVVGWPSFVEESRLQPGDVYIFELIDRESVVLKVHIFRSHT